MNSPRRNKASMANIIGDPFALATISISFVRNNSLEQGEGTCADTNVAGLVDCLRRLYRCRCTESLPQICLVDDRIHAMLYHWYYDNLRCWRNEPLCYCGMLPTQNLRTRTNSFKIVGYLAAGLVMTTSAVSTLIYQNAGTMQAAAAGFILLSMISVRSLTLVPSLQTRLTSWKDYLDLLLRICTSSYTPTIRWWFRTTQGQSWLSFSPQQLEHI